MRSHASWLALLFFSLPLAQYPYQAQAQAKAPAPLLVLQGQGDQIYRCDSSTWVLDHPEAKLVDADGKPVGTHSAGPTWTYQDGSSVQGEPIQTIPSPVSIPWLILRATTHHGAGLLAQVQLIRRSDTQGGLAPTTPCGAAGTLTRVPYSATYSFFTQSPPAPAK